MELSDQSETRSRYGVHINPAEKKQQNPVQNTIENVMGLMVIMGIVLLLMESIMVSSGM